MVLCTLDVTAPRNANREQQMKPKNKRIKFNSLFYVTNLRKSLILRNLVNVNLCPVLNFYFDKENFLTCSVN